MPSYERAGRLKIPQWWLDLALAKLDQPGIRGVDVAARASAFVGRRKPWDASAISKFKAGHGRTMQMVEGLSFALGIVRPFFTASTETAANVMMQLEGLSNPVSSPDAAKFALADQAVATEVRKAIVDGGVERRVVSSNNGDSRGAGVRSRVSRR